MLYSYKGTIVRFNVESIILCAIMRVMANVSNTTAEIEIRLGERVRALRIRRNLTQDELALRGGVSRRALVNLERGQGSSVTTLVRVLKGLDVPDILASIAPAPTVSPLALLRRRAPRQRVRRPRHPEGGH
jgi:DNA-binding XRE family transcriptional regulator